MRNGSPCLSLAVRAATAAASVTGLMSDSEHARPPAACVARTLARLAACKKGDPTSLAYNVNYPGMEEPHTSPTRHRACVRLFRAGVIRPPQRPRRPRRERGPQRLTAALSRPPHADQS